MVRFEPLKNVQYKHDYVAFFEAISSGKIPPSKSIEYYRMMARQDLFFLLYFGLERVDVNRPFIVQVIQEVEANHNNTIDLWAREHYKSTILNYGLDLQELVINPEERIGIFSHTRPIAKSFLRLIKNTLQDHPPLKAWFPDVFYYNPRKEAPKWSEDDGLMVKRKMHSPEASIEAWGMVDGQPTSKHFTVRVYDDVVTKESVTNPEQIAKTQEAWELSQSLGTDGGQKRILGTHYHFADLYTYLKKQPGYTVRLKPATDDGLSSGDPVLLSSERLAELRRDQGPYVFSCQQLLKPVAKEDQKFRGEWLRFYGVLPAGLNDIILVDPANEKKKKSDYTTMGVLSIDATRNWFLRKLIRDKLDLKGRWDMLCQLVEEFPHVQFVGYEQYGMVSDITYFEEKMEEAGVYFTIEQLGGNQLSKDDRIMRLVALFRSGKFYLPHHCYYKDEDMIKIFIDEEYLIYPYVLHDDILDMFSRTMDELPLLAPTSRMTAEQARQMREKCAPPPPG